MMLSGIGDPDEIAGHGIEVVHASSAVGKNLMEHSGASVSVEVSVPTLTSDQGPIRSPIHVLDYLLNRRGPLATPIGHAQAFVRTEEGLAAPDIQIILSPSSYEIKDGKARRRKTPQMGFAVGLCRPQARGQIRLRSADPAAPPLIDHKLFGEKADVDRIAAGIRIALKIVGAPAFAPFVKKVVGPLDTSDEGLDAYIRETGYLMYHPSGTCKMAPGADGVVDDRLRVKGIDRLWIADASIIPTIPAGNINATCIMIGEKAADLIRQDSTDQRKAA
jgi:choline dehydrogenase